MLVQAATNIILVRVVHLVDQVNNLSHNVFVLSLELIQQTRFLHSFDIFRFDGVFAVVQLQNLVLADLRLMALLFLQ